MTKSFKHGDSRFMILTLKFLPYGDSIGENVYSIELIISRFLLNELGRIQNDISYESMWLRRCLDKDASDNGRAFALNASAIYLFISGTPCGDASIDLLASNAKYSTPWTMRPGDEEANLPFRGHEYLWEKGKVRFKPGIFLS
jgi:hypothetical protein